METANKLKPAKKFGPGYFIKEQMEYRSWTQEELAEVMGITLKHLNNILKDKQAITLDTAKILAEVFDTSPQYWLNLDANYRLWKDAEPTEKEKQAELKANIYERMPIRDMLKKGWIPTFKTTEELEKKVVEFWQTDSLDFAQWDKRVAPIFQRKSESFNQYKAAYTFTWFHKAKLVAQTFSVPEFDRVALQDLFNSLHSYTILKNGINEFLTKLNEVGVVFFVLPHLEKTYLDGAAFYCEKNPVVVYTARYKRIDNFWFTVAHEIAHVLKHLDEENTYFLDNLLEKDLNDIETEANNMASEQLKHDEIVDFLKNKLNYLSTTDIEYCAQVLEIHPAIIIGKLAYDKTISYANQKLYNENVLEMIGEGYVFGFENE